MTDKELITILNSIQKTIIELIYNSDHDPKQLFIYFNETEKLIVEQLVKKSDENNE